MLNQEELAEFSKQHYPMVLKYCSKRLSNSEDAKDLTQEVFLVFTQKCHLIEEEHVVPWLFATAHKMLLREYKKHAQNSGRSFSYNESVDELAKKIKVIEDDIIDYYSEKYVDEIYSRLTPSEKKMFDLFSDGTIKTGEIAKIVDIEPHACSMRKKRLKEKCCDIMEEIIFI